MKTDEEGNSYYDAVEFENDLFTTDTFSFGTKIGQIKQLVCVWSNPYEKYVVNLQM